MAGVAEMLIHKIEYESGYGGLCDSHAKIIITEIILMIP
jgi:hypothetical protein